MSAFGECHYPVAGLVPATHVFRRRRQGRM